MINFLKFTWLYVLISVIVIGSGLFSIFRWGYNYSIDFTGGSNLQYLIDSKVNPDKIAKILRGKKIEYINLSIKDKTISLKTKPIDENKELKIRESLKKGLNIKISLLLFETVGPILGRETIGKTILASVIAILGILLYMSFAFKGFFYALSGILALFHDFLVVVGTYSLMSHYLGAEVDTLFVTAVLTTMSFSLHDTIVIFDKIREYLNVEGRGDIQFFANKALTETMVRSLNNSMTIVFMLLALILFGGSTIKFFIATLLVGTITGTYSSPFIATPILVWLEKRRK